VTFSCSQLEVILYRDIPQFATWNLLPVKIVLARQHLGQILEPSPMKQDMNNHKQNQDWTDYIKDSGCLLHSYSGLTENPGCQIDYECRKGQ
jgi:hypothetical protein